MVNLGGAAYVLWFLVKFCFVIFSDAKFTLYCLGVLSKLALFELIDLVFRHFRLFSNLAAFLFCIASGAKLNFASVYILFRYFSAILALDV